MRKILALLLLIPFLQLHAQDDGFVGSFDMQIHTYKKDKEEKDSPVTVRFWSKEDQLVMQPLMKGPDAQDVRMITDMKKDEMYTLITDASGKKMAMKMPRPKVDPAQAGEGEDDMEKTKTNETRTIEGHTVRKYVGRDEDGSWTAWVAEDLKAPFEQFSRALGGGATGKKQPKGPATLADGMPLETTWEAHDGREKMVMYMKNLKVGSVDEKAFDMSGYEVMELPGMMGGGR